MANKITLGDLSKTLTVEQVLEVIDGIVKDMQERLIPANIEHWTDDGGLHRAQFEKDLVKDLAETAEDELGRAIRFL